MTHTDHQASASTCSDTPELSSSRGQIRPATPLPWDYLTMEMARENGPFLLHAANAYPKLVEALKDAHEWVDNADPMGAHLDHFIRDLLGSLGELK